MTSAGNTNRFIVTCGLPLNKWLWKELFDQNFPGQSSNSANGSENVSKCVQIVQTLCSLTTMQWLPFFKSVTQWPLLCKIVTMASWFELVGTLQRVLLQPPPGIYTHLFSGNPEQILSSLSERGKIEARWEQKQIKLN